MLSIEFMLLTLCGHSTQRGLNGVMLALQVCEGSLDAETQLFEAFTDFRENGLCEIGIDLRKGFGDLESIPGARQDPTASRHGDDCDHGCIRSYGQASNTQIDLASRSTWAVNREICGLTCLHVVDELIESLGTAFVSSAQSCRAAYRQHAGNAKRRHQEITVRGTRNHSCSSGLGGEHGAELLAMQNSKGINAAFSSNPWARIIVEADVAAQPQQQHEESSDPTPQKP
jgi:hypothetical protein